MRILATLAVGAALTGCADFMKPPPETAAFKPQPVTLSSDSYCALSAKIRWSVNDTRPTIAQVRQANAKYDTLCKKEPVS